MDVLTFNGQGYLKDPQSGQVVPVAAAEVQAALDVGFAPASKDETAQARRMEHYGAGGKSVVAGLAGVARGATFGLSDTLLTEAGAAAPETLRGLKEANPSASFAGELAGQVGSFFVPGSPAAALTKVGTRAGEAVSGGLARMLAGSATRPLPQLAGAVVREGLIGAGVGAGQGISDVALAGDQMTPSEAVARIISSAGKGGAWGSGLGGLTWLARTGASKVKDRYTLGLEQIKGLRGERAALEAELSAAEASGASVEHAAQLQAQIAGVAQQLQEAQVGAVAKAFSRVAAYGLGHAIGGGVAGGLVGVVVGPKAMRALMTALKPVGAKVGEAVVELGEKARAAAAPYVGPAWDAAASKASAAWEKIAPAVERVAGTPVGEVVGNAAELGAEKVGGFARSVAERFPSAQRFAAAAGNVASRVPDAVAAGAMVGGLEGAAAGYVAHRFSEPIGRAVEGLMNKVAPAARLTVLDSMTSTDWKDVAEELRHVQPAGLDTSVRALLPEPIPAPVKDAVSQRLQAAVGFLQTLPGAAAPTAGPQQVPVAAAQAAASAASGTYERALRAIVDPGSVLQAFADGTLRPEQVAAWEAVYPEALQQVRAIVGAQVARASAHGGHYPREKADQIATLLGKRSAAPRLYQPATMARMQAMHLAARQPQRPQPPRGGRGYADQYLTPMQRHARGGGIR